MWSEETAKTKQTKSNPGSATSFEINIVSDYVKVHSYFYPSYLCWLFVGFFPWLSFVLDIEL